MTDVFHIRDRPIGNGHACYVIAEAGSNHNGSLEQALKLIEVAAQARADAVKFQTFKASKLYVPGAGTSDYLGDERSINDVIEAMEMPHAWLPILAEAAHDQGLAFMSTPFHEEAVDLLEGLVDAFKIASYEMSHHPLLRRVASTERPIIMSTGAHGLAEVVAAVEVIRNAGCTDLALLQCTAAYPAPPSSP